jgi:hypothetical protein
MIKLSIKKADELYHNNIPLCCKSINGITSTYYCKINDCVDHFGNYLYSLEGMPSDYERPNQLHEWRVHGAYITEIGRFFYGF